MPKLTSCYVVRKEIHIRLAPEFVGRMPDIHHVELVAVYAGTPNNYDCACVHAYSKLRNEAKLADSGFDPQKDIKEHKDSKEYRAWVDIQESDWTIIYIVKEVPFTN